MTEYDSKLLRDILMHLSKVQIPSEGLSYCALYRAFPDTSDTTLRECLMIATNEGYISVVSPRDEEPKIGELTQRGQNYLDYSYEGITLLSYKIRDFTTAAVQMEREIKRYGLTHNPQVPLIDKLSWNYNPWISMKTVSLFNLGIALELMLKLLLVMYEQKKPRSHKLTRLYDSLPNNVQHQLEKGYQKELSEHLDVGSIVAFIDHPIPRPDKRPPRRQPDIPPLEVF